MVNQDLIYSLKQIFDRLLVAEKKLEKLHIKTEDTVWDNAQLMQEWRICKRTAANYRENGLGYFKRGGLIFYTAQNRAEFINRKKK